MNIAECRVIIRNKAADVIFTSLYEAVQSAGSIIRKGIYSESSIRIAATLDDGRTKIFVYGEARDVLARQNNRLAPDRKIRKASKRIRHASAPSRIVDSEG